MEAKILLVKISTIGVGSMITDEYHPINTLLEHAPEFMRPFIDEPVLYLLEDDDGEIVEMQGSLESLSLDVAAFADLLKEAEQFGNMMSAARYQRPIHTLGEFPWLKQEPFPFSEKSSPL